MLLFKELHAYQRSVGKTLWSWGCTSVRLQNLLLVVLVTKSCLTLFRPHGLQPASPLCPWDSPGKNTGVGSPSFLKGIFLTQGSNPSLLHCQADSLPLSHLGSPQKHGIYFKNSCEVCILFPMYPCLFGIKAVTFSKPSSKQILWGHVAQVQPVDQQRQHHLELVINAEFQHLNVIP